LCQQAANKTVCTGYEYNFALHGFIPFAPVLSVRSPADPTNRGNPVDINIMPPILVRISIL
jgi:hypothetical protein